MAYNGDVLAGHTLELVEVEQSRLEGVRFTGACMRQAVFSDTVFQTCDFATLRAQDVSLVRAEVTAGRLTGASWSQSHFNDVRFEGDRADLSLWRHSKFKSVTFEDCNLTQADFQFAELRDALFSHCDLTGAQFGNVQVQRVRFEDCTMADVGGAAFLRGAAVQGPGALDLALALVREAGIRLEL
ncbi:pentapeptide repeat-containing protein [Streptomyces sp. NPDC012794]|uniref:pentapeptide repeat-containing protein n=1 Tax=Streptomyces sp. NPDC012794 TaxID=3364850 RepID=UPI00368C579E